VDKDIETDINQSREELLKDFTAMLKKKEKWKNWSKEYYKSHKAEFSNRSRSYYETHKEELRKYHKEHYRANKDKYRKQSKEYIEAHRDGYKKLRSSSHNKLKLECLKHYGNGKLACVRCGYSDIRALSIDHTKGGGSKHIKLIKSGLYRWLKKNNFPKDYQTLCMNCQLIKKFENHEFRR
jgi:exonuclease VII large subunit